MSDNHGHTLWDAVRLPIDAFVTEIPDNVWNAVLTHATAPTSTLASLELIPPDDFDDDPGELALESDPDVDDREDVDDRDDADANLVDVTDDSASAVHSTIAGADGVAGEYIGLGDEDSTVVAFDVPDIEQHHHDGIRGDQW